MFPSNDGKRLEKYRPLASQKNVNAAILKWKSKKWPEIFSVKLIENVQQ